MFDEIIKIVALAAPLILKAEMENGVPGEGAARKAAVVKAIDDIIAKPGGLDWPGWMPDSAKSFLLSGSIDLAVFLFNKAGGPELIKKFGL